MRIVWYVAVFLCGGGVGFGVSEAMRQKTAPTCQADLSVADGGVYGVRNVVDGDTIVLENALHVRYLGLNAPETGHFVKDAAPLAVEATARNIELLKGKRVRLRLPSNFPLDVHGRVLARVFAVAENSSEPETDVGAVLLKEGLGRTMGVDIAPEQVRELKALEDEAKTAKRGIWGLEDKARETGKPYCAATASTIYHLSACPTAQRIKAANRHDYDSTDAAEACGLKPCNKCVAK